MTTTAPAIPTQISDQIALAERLATSNLLPDAYRKQPANLIWAIQYAQALGVHPMTAITGISVINGKPTASAQLIGGLVRRAGHKLRVQSTETKAVAEVIRADDPGFTFRVEWTMDRARKAGLGGRGPWQQYPAAMLAARAITEVARMAAPEALFGIIYTAEELGADVDPDGEPIVVTVEPVGPIEIERTPVAVAEYRAKTGEPLASTTIPPQELRPRLIDETMTGDEPAKVTKNQITRIAILRKELGLDLIEDVFRDRLASLYNGKRSTKELTKAEADDLIKKLTEAQKRDGNASASA